MKTMRERFDEQFTSVWNSKHSEFIRIPDGIKSNMMDFIKQELKKEREEILQMIENYLWFARYGNDDDLNPVYERAFEEIINTIKKRT